MNCHLCGQRQATIHLLELRDGQQKSVWLCSICAAGRPEIRAEDLPDAGFRKQDHEAGDSASLASLPLASLPSLPLVRPSCQPWERSSSLHQGS